MYGGQHCSTAIWPAFGTPKLHAWIKNMHGFRPRPKCCMFSSCLANVRDPHRFCLFPNWFCDTERALLNAQSKKKKSQFGILYASGID